jgi:DNA (cytosine-5)-methyltransferase 1
MIGIDLFAGAGGMTQGAKLANVAVRLAIENNPHAAATYRANHPEVDLFDGDIAKFSADRLPSEGNNLILFGGRPCQGFSTSNQRNRNFENPRNWLFREFFRVAKLCDPEWVVFENVTGIAQTEGGFFLESAIKRLKRLGYKTNRWVLNAADYGVPQLRERVFVVGSRRKSLLDKPKPTVCKYLPVSDALDDLPELVNGSDRQTAPYKRDAISEYAISLRGTQSESTGHCVTKNAEVIDHRQSRWLCGCEPLKAAGF